MWKPTTFFPEYNVSVHMDETETVPGPSFQDCEKPSASNIPNYFLTRDYHHLENKEEITEKSEIEMQMELLQRVKLAKAKEREMTETFRHLTYKVSINNFISRIGFIRNFAYFRINCICISFGFSTSSEVV